MAKKEPASVSMLVLALLKGREMYGYQIIEELDRRSEHVWCRRTLEKSGAQPCSSMNAVSLSMLAGSASLKGREMYGYQIIEELDKRSEHVFQMKEGTLYPVLHGLEETDLRRSPLHPFISCQHRRLTPRPGWPSPPWRRSATPFPSPPEPAGPSPSPRSTAGCGPSPHGGGGRRDRRPGGHGGPGCHRG